MSRQRRRLLSRLWKPRAMWRWSSMRPFTASVPPLDALLVSKCAWRGSAHWFSVRPRRLASEGTGRQDGQELAGRGLLVCGGGCVEEGADAWGDLPRDLDFGMGIVRGGCVVQAGVHGAVLVAGQVDHPGEHPWAANTLVDVLPHMLVNTQHGHAIETCRGPRPTARARRARRDTRSSRPVPADGPPH
ncbi:hypothetical protein KEM60_01229 [Austwickia sp. TVS 96-490-7B]|nr:hypothetical protein [Austwickia sp. TVS 96-490-7B]